MHGQVRENGRGLSVGGGCLRFGASDGGWVLWIPRRPSPGKGGGGIGVFRKTGGGSAGPSKPRAPVSAATAATCSLQTGRRNGVASDVPSSALQPPTLPRTCSRDPIPGPQKNGLPPPRSIICGWKTTSRTQMMAWGEIGSARTWVVMGEVRLGWVALL